MGQRFEIVSQVLLFVNVESDLDRLDTKKKKVFSHFWSNRDPIKF